MPLSGHADERATVECSSETVPASTGRLSKRWFAHREGTVTRTLVTGSGTMGSCLVALIGIAASAPFRSYHLVKALTYLGRCVIGRGRMSRESSGADEARAS